MRLRGRAKRFLFGSLPGLRGRFRYFGHTVYFPRGSYIFELACQQGVYEQATIDLILSLVAPGTTYLDIGANIGLLSIPVLAKCPDVKVVSVEASPITLGFLLRTHAAAPRRDDWTIVGVAVGAQTAEAEFWSAGGAQDAFSGLRDTGRGGPKQPLKVPVRTLDDIWRSCGSPPVSVVKVDIEGGESLALAGARACIAAAKPIFLIEWTRQNLRAYDVRPEALLQLCATIGYAAYACPNLVRVDAAPILSIAMAQTETFLLAPLG